MGLTEATDRVELAELRAQLERAHAELERLRDELESRRHIVDILHDVMGNLSSDEIFHMLVRRLARALSLSQASVVLAKAGARRGTVAVAYEQPNLQTLEIELARYPEIQLALNEQRPVLIPDIHTSVDYGDLRRVWASEGLTITVRSVIALPFELDEEQSGVFLLRRSVDQPPLGESDVEFARVVVSSALMAIQRAHAVEETRADNLRLEALAHLDPLTELLNRRALTARLGAELDRVRRYDSTIALLLLDLDHFKAVNDTHGHVLGDAVLAEFGTLLQRAARSVDIVARYGGDEFVIVLPETSHDGALAFAERLRERVEGFKFRLPGGQRLRLTASVGIATFPAVGVDGIETLLATADTALYRAKQHGRNKVSA